MQSIERFQKRCFKTVLWYYSIEVLMTKFLGLVITGLFWSWVRLDSMSPWYKRTKAKSKTNFRYWKATQFRYKTFSNIAAEKQSYHCGPYWEAYIYIATEELLSNISSMNSLTSLQLAEQTSKYKYLDNISKHKYNERIAY